MSITLKDVERQGTWGDMVDKINQNNLAVKIEIEKLQNAGGGTTGGGTTVSDFSVTQKAESVDIELKLSDGTIKTAQIHPCEANTEKLGVVRTTNSITSENNSNSLVPTYSVVYNIEKSKAPLVSPVLTGTPTAPTATKGTNNTQIATTAFVQEAAKQAKTDAIEAILGENVDADFDTLKEVADYIASDKTNAANIETKLSTHGTQITALSSDMATLKSDANVPGSVKNIVNGAIGNLRESDIITKVGSASSDTLDVTLGAETQGGKNLNIELKSIGTKGNKTIIEGDQTPVFGGKVQIHGFTTDEYGRVTGVPTTAHTIQIPNTVASTNKAGLMSSTDKVNLENIIKAMEWIDITA